MALSQSPVTLPHVHWTDIRQEQPPVEKAAVAGLATRKPHADTLTATGSIRRSLYHAGHFLSGSGKEATAGRTAVADGKRHYAKQFDGIAVAGWDAIGNVVKRRGSQ